jgi:starvation-inducible outer membrane lipoprotein
MKTLILTLALLSGCAAAPQYVSKYDALIESQRMTLDTFITYLQENDK